MNRQGFIFYMDFALDSSRVKVHGQMMERKTPKYDLARKDGCWEGFDKLKNARGGVSVTLTKTTQNPNFKQEGTTPSVNISIHLRKDVFKSSSYNLTGIKPLFHGDEDSQVCFGEPLQDEFMKNGMANPLYSIRSDGYLIILSDFTGLNGWPKRMELFIIKAGRLQVGSYAEAVRLRTYDDVIEDYRSKAQICN